MPWKKYWFHFRGTVECQQCGRRVRLQGWLFLAAIAVVLLAGVVATLFFLESSALRGSLFATLAVVSIVIDWWSWKTFRWAPEPGATDAD